MAQPADIQVVVVEDEPDNSTRYDPKTKTLEIDQPDGGVVVQFDQSPGGGADEGGDDKHFENLAEKLGDARLSEIAQTLYEAVSADDRSRNQKLQDITRGLDLLGLRLEEPKSDADSATGGVAGMSTVTNPLLLEACLKGWANSQAELLPASGPCKIQDYDSGSENDELADAFERDMNWYFTVGAPEYYPDTSSMLLWGTYFSGGGFKKIYRCPLRRRPVSDTVDVKDLIVSDTTKDFRACERITHVSQMRTSTVKRMRLLGEFVDTPLMPPTPQPTVVDEKIASIQGTTASPKDRPEDQPYTLWEIQCELDLQEFAPGEFKDEHIALPYRVVMERDSQQIWALRRDWNPEDEQCNRKRLYVKYPYVPGPGFYGTGLVNILGNASAAMTAAWREALDAGMYANFPAGLIAEIGGRQNSSTFRLAPGEFKPIKANGQDIRTLIMGMPYKDVTPGLLALIDKITAQSKELGGAADIPASEGLQNIPVGTMLASIEQATKIMSAAHKGMHTAQSEEIQMVADLFREHPDDFWRNNKGAKNFWNEQRLLQALNDYSLVPKSDPNVPSHIHRVMKALALVALIQIPVFAPRMDAEVALKRILGAIREDAAGLVIQPTQGGEPPLQDQAKMLGEINKSKKVQLDAATAMQKSQDKAAENKTKTDVAAMQLASEMVIHSGDREHSANQHSLGVANQMLAGQQHGLAMRKQAHTEFDADRKHQLDAMLAVRDTLLQQRGHDREDQVAALDAQQAARDQALAEEQQRHQQGIDLGKQRLDTHVALHPPKPKKP